MLMRCENWDDCPITECACREIHEECSDCDIPCQDVNENDVMCEEVEDSVCGCHLCNGVTQHDQDMNYVCDECKEEQ
jgi:hypothetical protein